MKKSSIMVTVFALIAGFTLLVSGIYLNQKIGKYNKIYAADKNAYITNLDVSTNPPTVYVSFDYDVDRSIIGRLPKYREGMQECDWLTIYYNIENPRTITEKNPHIKDKIFIIIGYILLVVGISHIIYYRCGGRSSSKGGFKMEDGNRSES